MQHNDVRGQGGGRERRRTRRITIGLPVRMRIDGDRDPQTVELRDLSVNGCYVRTEAPPRVFVDQRVAVGFVLPGPAAALARGRVVRIERDGFALEVERRNGAFDEFVRGMNDEDPGALAA